MMGTILEAALRSLLAAVVVGACLRALQVRNVLAQKAAWGAVLATALAMPMLLPTLARWQVARLVVHTTPMTLLEELQARIRAKNEAKTSAVTQAQPKAPSPAKPRAAGPPLAAENAPDTAIDPPSDLDQPAIETGPQSASVLVVPDATPAPAQPRAAAMRAAPAIEKSPAPKPSRWHLPSAFTLAVLVYALVALVLTGRLLIGLAAAFALRSRAQPVELGAAEPLDLRVSEDVSSPVTIGSSVVLPADCAEWSAEKLRIVLAHEGSHIRQKDFYLQLAAGLHASLFWFSPLGWWLKRTLSELAEAISDRAGVEQAESRSSYAQVLLEFAASPRNPMLGVAMARTGNLSRRIERLLNENSFHQAYAGTRRRALALVLLVPAVLFAATSLVRVEASGQEQAPASPSAATTPAAQPTPTAEPAAAEPATPAEPREGQSDPDDAVATQAPAAPQAAPTPRAVPAPPAAPAPPGDVVIAPPPPGEPVVIVDSEVNDDDAAPTVAFVGKGKQWNVNHTVMIRHDDSGDSYIVVRGDGPIRAGGPENDALQKARKMTKGDFVLYTHQGKSYVIDDPATVDQIAGTMGPLNMNMNFKFKVMRDQNREMAKMQRDWAEKSQEMAEKQKVFFIQQDKLNEENAKEIIHSQDLNKQMKELNETVARLQAKQDAKLTDQDLAELRSEVAQLQAQLGGMQIRLAYKTKLDMPKIDIPKIDIEPQIIEAQRNAEESIKKMQMESDKKMQSIIDQSMKDGKAKPIQ